MNLGHVAIKRLLTRIGAPVTPGAPCSMHWFFNIWSWDIWRSWRLFQWVCEIRTIFIVLLKQYLPLLLSWLYGGVFQRLHHRWHHNESNAEANLRILLSSLKPDIKEGCKYKLLLLFVCLLWSFMESSIISKSVKQPEIKLFENHCSVAQLPWNVGWILFFWDSQLREALGVGVGWRERQSLSIKDADLAMKR